jgi:hypothetical protein
MRNFYHSTGFELDPDSIPFFSVKIHEITRQKNPHQMNDEDLIEY